MRAYVGTLLLVVIALDATALAAEDNLFPNGDAESEWVNLVFGDKGFARHIQARDTGMSSFWRLADGARIGYCCASIAFGIGIYCVSLLQDAGAVDEIFRDARGRTRSGASGARAFPSRSLGTRGTRERDD